MRGKPLQLPDELPDSSGKRHKGKLAIPVPDVSEWFQLRLNIRPVPKARPRARVKPIGKGRFVGEVYTPANSKLYEMQIRLLALLSDIWYVPEGPVGLIQWFAFKRPKRLMRKKDPEGPIWRPQDPDSDNMEKAVWDALNGVAWKDDNQVNFHVCYDVFAPKGQGSFVDLTFFTLEGAEKEEQPHRVTMIEETIAVIQARRKQLEREAKKKNAPKKTHGF